MFTVTPGASGDISLAQGKTTTRATCHLGSRDAPLTTERVEQQHAAVLFKDRRVTQLPRRAFEVAGRGWRDRQHRALVRRDGDDLDHAGRG